MTRNLIRLFQHVGSVLAVTAAIAVVGGVVQITAAGLDNQVKAKQEKDDRGERAREEKAKREREAKVKREREEREHRARARRDRDDDDGDREGHRHRVAAGPDHKVGVCHVAERGRFELITVSASGESAHRAHGDVRPGEAMPKDASVVLDAGCHPVARQPEPPPEPQPKPAIQLACPCWSSYTDAGLVSMLTPSGTASEPSCTVNSSTVSLSPDLGATKLVYASSFGACILRVDGVDVGSNFSLSFEEASQCVAESTAIVPALSWCPQ